MNETNKHTRLITSEHNWLELNLKEVWKYRDLIWLFSKRSFVVTYKQTILGPMWILLNPLISALMYAFVFGGIAGIETDGVPELLFYLSGNAIWLFFSTSLTKNASTFVTNAHVFGKVYFPRLTMPLSTVLSAVIQFIVQMLLVLIFLAFYVVTGVVSPNWAAWLLIPVVLVHLGLLALGFGVSLWMYATPVVYPMSTLGDGLMKTLLMINPVTQPVELFRYALLGVGTVNWLYYGLSWALTIVVTLLGIMIFNKVEKTFMDTV